MSVKVVANEDEAIAHINRYGTMHSEAIVAPDLVMADFRSYVDAWEKLTGSYGDQETWNRKALLNTASSGWFSSDRTIREYRDEIWHA